MNQAARFESGCGRRIRGDGSDKPNPRGNDAQCQSVKCGGSSPEELSPPALVSEGSFAPVNFLVDHCLSGGLL